MSTSATVHTLRRRAMLSSFVRHMFVPGLTLYGLFLLRPREGQFIRYLAEKRHFDAQFNELFPPLNPTASAPAVTAIAAAPSSRSPTNNKDLPTSNNNTSSPPSSSSWRRFFSSSSRREEEEQETKMEEARRERRRQIFRDPQQQGTDATNGTSRAAPQQHPAGEMYQFVQQMEEMSAARRKALLTAGVMDNLAESEKKDWPVSIQFDEYIFFSKGTLIFQDQPSGKVNAESAPSSSSSLSQKGTTHCLTFCGAMGSVWWEMGWSHS